MLVGFELGFHGLHGIELGFVPLALAPGLDCLMGLALADADLQSRAHLNCKSWVDLDLKA